MIIIEKIYKAIILLRVFLRECSCKYQVVKMSAYFNRDGSFIMENGGEGINYWFLQEISVPRILISGARLLMPIPTTKLAQYILKQSFGIYLFHILFIYALVYFLGDVLNPLVMLPLVFVVSVVGSCVVTEMLRKVRLSFIIGA